MIVSVGEAEVDGNADGMPEAVGATEAEGESDVAIVGLPLGIPVSVGDDDG